MSERADYWRQYCAKFRQIKESLPGSFMSDELIHDEVFWMLTIEPYLREQLERAGSPDSSWDNDNLQDLTNVL